MQLSGEEKNYKTKLTESRLSEFSHFISDLVKLLLPCLLHKNEHDHHPLLTPLQNVITLRQIRPLPQNQKHLNQATLPSSSPPITITIAITNNVPRPGTIELFLVPASAARLV